MKIYHSANVSATHAGTLSDQGASPCLRHPEVCYQPSHFSGEAGIRTYSYINSLMFFCPVSLCARVICRVTPSSGTPLISPNRFCLSTLYSPTHVSVRRGGGLPKTTAVLTRTARKKGTWTQNNEEICPHWQLKRICTGRYHERSVGTLGHAELESEKNYDCQASHPFETRLPSRIPTSVSNRGQHKRTWR